ncbi:GAF domain-containing sensor histidine kinase [Actinoplanes friuliensis]|uniref:Oxygen sensor histidine kinase NreB n=1 Tax=Actinoplanes friuliensis DSM 7358 TaxID=1246995 RepID=U5W105_9ACTN|nr:GAF domain-containing sensor histidine kinase [Actinoplanes friuliensis]AGZ41635.1 two-component system sensor kinase [Actinoplanes friuliensis DSM 7358]
MTACDRAELREVSEAVLAVTARLSVRDVLQTIVASARRLLDARYAALGVPGPADTFAEFLTDGISDEQWRAIGPLPRRHGLLGAMLRDPEPVRLTDVRSHPRFGWWPAAHPELTDFLGVPILHGDEILGSIFLANKTRPGGFTADDEELLRLLAAHAAIALVNARLYEQSRELSIVAERNRIARELHDAVAQKLFSLRLTADAAATLVTRDATRALAELDTVRRLAAEATEELRAIVVGLRPAELAGDGLDVALRKQADLLDRVHAPAVRFAGAAVPRLPAVREEAAFRIAQEALHNALRHAGPGVVTVTLRAAGGSVVLEVGDDGRGFDPREASRQFGLASMRERARGAGGRLDVLSRPGEGTTVRLEVPLE